MNSNATQEQHIRNVEKIWMQNKLLLRIEDKTDLGIVEGDNW